jgi:surface polysaccharide O-acyltransferase-like enzyme
MVYPWSDDDLSKELLITLLDNGTVLFVFIAGFLFQHLQDRFNYIPYLKKKFQYVVLPYILVSLPAILNRLFIEPGTWEPAFLMDSPDVVKGLYLLATGKHLGPFWFIPMIILFYLISPLFIALDHPKFHRYMLPFLLLGSLFTYRFGYFSNSIDSAIHFLPVYIFGIFASRYKDFFTIGKNWLTWVMVVVYVILAILELSEILPVYRLNSEADAASSLYFGFNSPKLRMMLLCLILIKVFYKIQHRRMPVLRLLGDYSFGLYFIHLYVIIALDTVYRKFVDPQPVFSLLHYVILLSMTVFVSLGIIWIVRKVAGNKSRMLIGS